MYMLQGSIAFIWACTGFDWVLTRGKASSG